MGSALTENEVAGSSGSPREIDNAGIICREQETCILCGAPGLPFTEGMKDRLFGAKGVWRFDRCTNQSCGLVWLQPHPRVDQIIKLYSSYYTHGAHEDPHGAHEEKPTAVPGGKMRLAKTVLAKGLFWKANLFRSDLRYLESLPPGALLEVGCGDGYFLAEAAKRGWKVHGIDFDEKAIAQAKALGIDQVVVGDLTTADYPADSFDAVVMSNVIEHLHDPVATLRICRRLLKQGGRLISITPNVEFDRTEAFRAGLARVGAAPPPLPVEQDLHPTPGETGRVPRRGNLLHGRRRRRLQNACDIDRSRKVGAARTADYGRRNSEIRSP